MVLSRTSQGQIVWRNEKNEEEIFDRIEEFDFSVPKYMDTALDNVRFCDPSKWRENWEQYVRVCELLRITPYLGEIRNAGRLTRNW